MVSKLLINEYPIFVLPTLAEKVGVYEAIFLQQLHYWLNKSEHVYDGRRWVYNSMESWHNQFPFISVSTIRRIIKKLEEEKIILTGNFNRYKMDRTKWYTIDYEALDSLFQDEQIEEPELPQTTSKVDHNDEPMNQSPNQTDHMANNARPHDLPNMTAPIPDTTSEITSDKKEEEENARKNEPHSKNINPYTFFEQNGFGTIGGYIAEKIKYWCEDLSEELVVEAMKLAVEYGAKHWSYVESILRYWFDKGYETVNDVHAARKAFKERLSQKQTHTYRPIPSTPPNDTEYDMNAGEVDDE